MNRLLCLCLIIVAQSCKETKEPNATKQYTKSPFTEIDFKIESFDWDPDPFRFPSYIQDSIVSSRGTQVAAWSMSYIGDIEGMHQLWDAEMEGRPKLTQEQQDSFAQFHPSPAIDYIIEQAKPHQVVIINEGHHMPQHRVFTTRLLDGLKEEGYKHLGLETYFGNPKTDSLLNLNGYPTLMSGYYTKEPQFGNLIRQAHSKGFALFGYESRGHKNAKEREINQAKNIQAYAEEHPGEKILIHCGFDHGYEGEIGKKWGKAMAGRLTEFSGLDPFTINQVLYSERSKREYEDPYYQLTDVKEPSVFLDKNRQHFARYKAGGNFDVAVFHPRSGQYNRPSWMSYDERYEVSFSFEEEDIVCPCLVFAYKAGEEVGVAVPYDVQPSDDKKVKLVLDTSNYEIIVWAEDGKALQFTWSK